MAENGGESVEPSGAGVIADRYKVLRVLGRGGMATVYLCEDAQTSEKVAVKVLRHEIGSAVVVERFLREIEFASRLDHQRIPKVLDSGTTANGTPFYVMNYIEGESLRDLLDRVKQLPIEQALSITADVIEPMTYAHRMGIVHRDIKPGNIIIGVDGVHVLDFGIARAIVESAEDRLTSTGIAIGTPAYMSPEQALGDQDLDARSDIYSLGCVIYEMIAGIPPFVGATPQAAMARRFAAIAPPLSETRDGVPPHIVAAVAKALSRTPADRWQTVRMFGDALAKPAMDKSSQMVADRAGRRRTRAVKGVMAVVVVIIGAAATFAAAELRGDHLSKVMADVADWDFAAAERRLEAVVSSDPERASEQVMLAQLRMLKGEPAAGWKPLLIDALSKPGQLDSLSALRARALLSFAERNYDAACVAFAQLGTLSGKGKVPDFTAPLANADCLRADQAVVPDSSSPSGFRFRSSYAFIESVYSAMLDRNERNARAYSALAPRLQQLLTLDPRLLRTGHLIGTTRTRVYSLPTLVADTLSYVPRPLPPDGGTAEFGESSRLAAAVDRNRRRLRAVATAWTKRAPEDPLSHEMLAAVLEAGGEIEGTVPSALYEIGVARKSIRGDPTNSGDAFRQHLLLGDTHVRLLLRIGHYKAAGSLADSLLALRGPSTLSEDTQRQTVDVQWRLSALRGRVERVIDLEVPYAADVRALTDEGPEDLPPIIALDVIALNNYSAFGGPPDSIGAIADRISARLAGLVAPAKVKAIRQSLLARPFMLAAPVIGTDRIVALPPGVDPLKLAMLALSRRNAVELRRQIRILDDRTKDISPGEISMDVTYLKAWLVASVGDEKTASKTLDNAFAGISKASKSALGSPELIGSFVRSMLLRAELAARSDEHQAARAWTTAASDLWGSAAISAHLSRTLH